MDPTNSQSNTDNLPFSSSTSTSTTNADPFVPVVPSQPLQPLQTQTPVAPLEPFNVTQAVMPENTVNTVNPVSASNPVPVSEEVQSNVLPPVEEPKKGMSILNILLLVVAVILLLSLTYIVYAKFTTKPEVDPATYTQVQPTEEPVPADTTATEPADSANEPTMAPVGDNPDVIPTLPEVTPTP